MGQFPWVMGFCCSYRRVQVICPRVKQIQRKTVVSSSCRVSSVLCILFIYVTCSLLDPGKHMYEPCASGARSRSCVRRRQPAFRANFIPAPVLRRHGDQACFAPNARAERGVLIKGTVWKHYKPRQPCEDREDFCALDLANMHQAWIRTHR